ncbi:MAG: hypothetical protein K2L97_07075 [Muribaculaceae bacterium]|nr:hypothetical protein [Muribaculaceae bacterium]
MPKSIADRLSWFATALGSTAASCLRMAVKSGHSGLRRVIGDGDSERPILILGNGPSLKSNLERDMECLQRADTMAVNFFANSPEFMVVKPDYYVLADPHFFDKADSDPNVSKLIANLNTIDFEMTLLIPAVARGRARRLFDNRQLTIETFNFVAVEGFGWFENMMFGLRCGMPRPRNVLVPAIMTALWLGYKKIYLLGADHSWLSTLSVNDNNEVVSVQPHFYKEDEREVTRIRSEYVRHPLHEVLESMMIAFRSYHRIREYADREGVEVINVTPGSMIDAFVRQKDFTVGD